MELLELNKNLEATQDTSGPDLYYGVYRNRLMVPFRSVGRVRYHDTIEKFHNRLSYVHPIIWGRGVTHQNNVTVADYIANEGGNVSDLLNFIKWRTRAQTIKIVLNLHKVTIYYNDTVEIKDFVETFPEKVDKFTLCYRIKMPNFERGVVYQKNPQHRWRIYLRSGLLEDISTAIEQYRFYPCPTIKRNLTRTHKIKFWTYENNFVDCDDEGLITVFALKFPNAVKKVCRIESR